MKEKEERMPTSAPESVNADMLQKADTKDIQRHELEILDIFMSICQKNGFRYYLNAGTLLGAVRHCGFIPWDDDIDVCMPRSDYEKFLSLASEQLPSNMRAVVYKKQTPEEHPQYTCQILNMNVPLLQMIAEKPRKTFAWIDVFPLDGMPSNCIAKEIHGFMLLFRRAMVQLSMLQENVNIYKKRPFHERMIIWFGKKTGVWKKLNTRNQMDKLDKLLCRYSDLESDLWINFMGAYKLKETFPKQWYGEGKPYSFEGRSIPGPIEAHGILTALYGDYMTPRRPVNEEETHCLYAEQKENEDFGHPSHSVHEEN